MKLKNKKTGEIVEGTDILALMATGDYLSLPAYRSLAELNEEWEDYDEPKEYWLITWCGEVDKETDDGMDVDNQCREIGNYFETEEEAKKAVKKLKAWKRLKDAGFKIKCWKFTPDMKQIEGNYVKIEAEVPQIIINEKDLDLLFGGEE